MFPLVIALALAADPPAAFPLFVAHSTAPAVKVGVLDKLQPDLAVVLVEPAAGVPAGELTSLRRADVPLPPPTASAHLRLANGDILRLKGVSADGDLRVKADALLGTGKLPQPVAVPLTAISALWFTDPPADTPPDPADYPWFDPAKKQDALLLQNGDVVRGTFEKLADDEAGSVRFKPAGEKAATPYPRSAVAALALDPSLARVKRPKGAYARITTADGSRVSASAVSCDGRVLDATTVTGAKIALPLADVRAVDILGGKATYLSDLTPVAKVEAFGGVAWPWEADRSVKGRPLKLKTVLGEETFARGLGLHPKTTLTYALNGKYKRFEATVGLDAGSGQRGAVDVTVLVDGKPQKLDGLTGLTFAAGVTVLGLDVSKAKELTLVVDFGPGGDVQDDVTFADARLVE